MTDGLVADLNLDNSGVIAGWVRSRRDATQFAGRRCPWPLDAAAVLQMADQPGRTARVLCRPAGTPVATGSLLYSGGDCARIGRILVDPARRGEGHGRRIVKALLAEAAALDGVHVIRLGVYEHNTVARTLYSSLGFQVTDLPSEQIQVEDETWIPLEMELHLSALSNRAQLG